MHLHELQNTVAFFIDERNWKQFHNPKDLAQAVSIETSELLEHFLWKTHEDIEGLTNEDKQEISYEMADVLSYLLSMADILEIDLADALIKKIEINKQKYPVKLSKNQSLKYNQ